MKLEYFLLGILKLKPQTGYELKQVLDTEGIYLRPSTPLSQVYTTLKQMTARCWLTFNEEERQGKPDLKIYHITQAGFQALQEYLRAPYVPVVRYQDREFLGLLAFSCFIEPDIVLKNCAIELAFRRQQMATNLRRSRTIEIDPTAQVDNTQVQFLFSNLDLYGRGALGQYVAWLEMFIEQYQHQIHNEDHHALPDSK